MRSKYIGYVDWRLDHAGWISESGPAVVGRIRPTQRAMCDIWSEPSERRWYRERRYMGTALNEPCVVSRAIVPGSLCSRCGARTAARTMLGDRFLESKKKITGSFGTTYAPGSVHRGREIERNAMRECRRLSRRTLRTCPLVAFTFGNACQ